MRDVLPSGNPARAQYRIDRFYGLDTSTADTGLLKGFSPFMLNCSTDDGTLKSAPGLITLRLPYYEDTDGEVVLPLLSKIISLGYFTPQTGSTVDRYLMAVSDAGKLYMLKINTPLRTWGSIFVSGYNYSLLKPCMAQFRQGDTDWLLVFSKYEKAVRVERDGAAYLLSADAPKAGSVCVHYERVFACDIANEPYIVRFSAPMDCTVWNSTMGSGYIIILSDFGKLERVISFYDAVYVFHEFGISRISAYARETEFAVSKIWRSDSQIIPSTVAICGDRVLFAARSGLFEFNGASVRKICPNLERIWAYIHDYDKAQGYTYDGKYILMCVSDLAGGYGGDPNTLITYNLDKGNVDISCGFAASAALALNYPGFKGFLLASGEYGDIYSYSGQIGNSIWTGPLTDFGMPDIVKRITDVYLVASGSGKITVNVTADGAEVEKSAVLTPKTRVHRMDLSLTGRMVSLGIKKPDSEPFCVQAIHILMDYMKDG